MAKRTITIRYFRNGKLDESLQSSRGFVQLAVFLGEERIGTIEPGHTGSIIIDDKSYVLTLQFWNPIKKMECFSIPADSHPNFGPQDYIYNVNVDDYMNNAKNFSKVLFKGIAMKFVAGDAAAQRLVYEQFCRLLQARVPVRRL